ncbi:unnamed protein product [Mytilus coruscus]|uniref:THAP-type domain-containing protein n=1 Tax=Mytilus coruscus TaxID=42192 RepID=A0A6J8C540_MYTCO|nr:unnamed protein product [Mytilus coruscus]
MVYGAAYGCNNEAKKGTGISFFRFPADVQLRKAWTHYCRRWNFVPGPNHRLFSAHFSKQSFTKDPDLMLQFNMTYKLTLRPDAKPDVPVPDTGIKMMAEIDDGEMYYMGPNYTGKWVIAYCKIQILQIAFDSHVRAPTPEKKDTATSVQLDDTDVPTTCTPNDPVEVIPQPNMTVETSPPKPITSIRMVNKKLQVKLQPQRRTRGHQTDSKITGVMTVQTKTFSTVATQTDEPSPKEAENPSDSDDDSAEPEDGDDSDYNPTDDEISSDDDDSDTESEMNYKLNSKATQAEEKQFMVSESALPELLCVCRYCSGEAVALIKNTRGSMVVTSTVCLNGHVSIWKSQSCHNTLSWGNLMTATAILYSWSNSSKVLQMFQHLNMQTISSRTYNRLQTLYVSPSASMAWDAEQTALLTDLYDKEVIIGGDARCDSPGYSAKYGSYTIMDLETSKILDFQLVQCNEVKGSARMELEGLKRSIIYQEGMMHIKIKDLVTDRHFSIKKFMRAEQGTTNHLFDVWHVAKGISKKLEAAAKKSGSKDIRPWIKSIVNHIYWISSSCGTNGDLKLAKWRSIVNHISNKHENHSILYPRCEHQPVTVDRQWLSDGSVPYKRLKDIVESRYLLVDVPKLSPVYQTYSLEVIHSLVNHFCPKSTHFFYPTMLARLSIAALHYNENNGRQQAKTKTGEQRFSMCYPKAKKGTEAVVKPKKTATTFGSVPYKRLKDIVESRYLLVDVPKLSPVYQTYSLEVFHSLVNHFCPKSTHFFYPTMLARLSIAALHYNENNGRQQAKTKTGEQRFSMCYPKAKKGTEAVVKPKKTATTFVYVTLMKQAVEERRREEFTSYTSATGDVRVYNNHHPDHMTSTFTPFRKIDLIQRHRSRFQRQ